MSTPPTQRRKIGFVAIQKILQRRLTVAVAMTLFTSDTLHDCTIGSIRFCVVDKI